MILTNDRHVNEITSLTGRNIVSGSPLLLSTHGIYDDQKVQDVKSMFEDPASSATLFKKFIKGLSSPKILPICFSLSSVKF